MTLPESTKPCDGQGSEPGWRLQVFPSLPSTSDLLVSLAGAGEPEGLAVLAMRQTAGRGSRGRSWTTPEGNLSLSVLLRPSGGATEAGRWALLAGVALWDALAAGLADPSALRLKWPNDVLLAGRKLAGILVDSVLDGQGRLGWLVVGLGANLAGAPDLPTGPAACLAEAGPAPSPEAVAQAVLDRLAHWRRVRLVEGFGAVRAAWLQRAHPVGTHLAVARGDQVVGGSFAGLAEDGALLLQTGGRVHAFATGDVLAATRG